MEFKAQLRNCDMFGVPIGLKLAGKSNYSTKGGLLTSLILKLFILSFFAIKLIDVIDYRDPSINSFTVLDSREAMTSPVFLDDYGFEIYFFFVDYFGRPVAVDSSIGSLNL